MLVGLVGVGLLAALVGCSETPQGVSQSAAPETIATETIATDTIATDTIAPETIAPETIATDTIATNTIATDTIATDTTQGTIVSGTVAASVVGALSIDDALSRAALLAALLQGLGPDAVSEVKIAWERHTRNGRGDPGAELLLIVEWLARHDPEGAYAWVQVHGGHQSPVVLRGLIRAWAARDPAAARGVISEGHTIRKSDQLTSALVEGWLESGLPGVEEYLVEMPPSNQQQFAISALVRRLIVRDGIDAALRWVEALPDEAPGRFKLQAYRRVASAVADIDPQRAAHWAEKQLAGDFGDGVPRRVGVSWGGQDGEAAMTWLASLPAVDHLPFAVDATYREWLRHDREGALRWLREAEPNPTFEPAISLYALAAVRDDPQTALEWAQRLQDEELRHLTLEKLARAWLANDPEAARAWIEGSELPEAAQQRVLAPPKKPQRTRPGKPQQRDDAAANRINGPG
jgi:hypothetical protein